MPPPIPPSVSFFVAINGQPTGPFDMATLSNMIGAGQFNQQTLVWKQGMESWMPANQVSELNNLFGAVPPPIPM